MLDKAMELMGDVENTGNVSAVRFRQDMSNI